MGWNEAIYDCTTGTLTLVGENGDYFTSKKSYTRISVDFILINLGIGHLKVREILPEGNSDYPSKKH